MPVPTDKEHIRRFLVEKLQQASGNWSRAVYDAQLAKEHMELYEKAIAEFDATGNLIV
jgi:hypothetical protein